MLKHVRDQIYHQDHYDIKTYINLICKKTERSHI